MCGIAGIFFGGSPSAIANMMTVVQRRGPEHCAIQDVGCGFLGHALLAFVEEGNNAQPYQEQQSAICWNGEIYNWKYLSERYSLSAQTDTQVLLRGLQTQGTDFLREIDGQFAFIAKLQTDHNYQIMVGRDKWGICPLSYAISDKTLIVASTPEAVQSISPSTKTVPAGTYGIANDGSLDFTAWFTLKRARLDQQKKINPDTLRTHVRNSIIARIPSDPSILFTTIGGIDSQFVTATVARETSYGGAITIVPWHASDPHNQALGDYHEANATLRLLKEEGIAIRHHVVPLTPDYLTTPDETGIIPLDRVLRILGPDYFNLCCGLAEDLVAATAKKHGGKAIMTAGGPDEAGRSYRHWAELHSHDLEKGFYAVCDQFSSVEGVRAGLIFGEQGLENRVPLADLIDLAMQMPVTELHRIMWNGMQIKQFEDKIFWRDAIKNDVAPYSLQQEKKGIYSSTGAMATLYHIANQDQQYQLERKHFTSCLQDTDWPSRLFKSLDTIDQTIDMIAEGQLYSLWRWRKLDSLSFEQGAYRRYGDGVYHRAIHNKTLRPICYDWLPAWASAKIHL